MNTATKPPVGDPNGGLVRESFQNHRNSGLGIIVICPDITMVPKGYLCFFVWFFYLQNWVD